MKNWVLALKLTKYDVVVLVPLTILSSLSVIQGFNNALLNSQDLQWSPARLFVSGVSPYLEFLAGNVNDALILHQSPNYLHLLYILFAPLGLLDFETAKAIWAITNFVIAFAVVGVISSIFELKPKWIIYTILIFFASLPFRNTIGNGQQSLLVLIFLIMPFYKETVCSWLLLGVGFCKYSFGPPFGLYYLLRYGFRDLLASAIFPLFGLIVFSAWTGQPIFEALFAPLRVASLSMANGTADIMTIVDLGIGGSTGKNISYAAAVFLTILLTLLTLRVTDRGTALVLICLTCLMTFKHLVYDMVFLLPLLAWLFTTASLKSRIWCALVLSWMWFGLRAVPTITQMTGIHISELALANIHFVLLGITFWQVYSVAKNTGAIDRKPIRLYFNAKN